MKTLLILLITMTTAFSYAGLESDILPENQVILKGSWNPTVAELRKTLHAAGRFLADPKNVNDWEKDEIKKILENSSKYCVQFSCETEDGKKLIRCNFLPAEERSTDWKNEWIQVFDGGFWHWRIDYDVSKDECLNFSSNGYA